MDQFSDESERKVWVIKEIIVDDGPKIKGVKLTIVNAQPEDTLSAWLLQPYPPKVFFLGSGIVKPEGYLTISHPALSGNEVNARDFVISVCFGTEYDEEAILDEFVFKEQSLTSKVYRLLGYIRWKLSNWLPKI